MPLDHLEHFLIETEAWRVNVLGMRVGPHPQREPMSSALPS